MSRSWEEKLFFVVLCWIVSAVSFLFMLSLIPENMIPYLIVWKVWLFVVMPVIMVVADRYVS